MILEDSETRPLDGNSSFSEILEFKSKIPDIVLKKKLLEIHLSVQIGAFCDMTRSSVI